MILVGQEQLTGKGTDRLPSRPHRFLGWQRLDYH
jgi:hypothetical protein